MNYMAGDFPQTIDWMRVGAPYGRYQFTPNPQPGECPCCKKMHRLEELLDKYAPLLDKLKD